MYLVGGWQKDIWDITHILFPFIFLRNMSQPFKCMNYIFCLFLRGNQKVRFQWDSKTNKQTSRHMKCCESDSYFGTHLRCVLDSVSPTHSRLLVVGNEQPRQAVLNFFKQIWLTSNERARCDLLINGIFVKFNCN